ncbi:MAG: ATP-binding protein, partial [Vicinamibacterales bacterium]
MTDRGGDASLTAIAGRADEGRAIRDCLADLVGGHGGLAIVTGEAGIGKTTMVDLLAREARQAGALVLAGHCYDLTATPPYGPWVELLSAYRPEAGLPPAPENLIDRQQLRPVGDRDAFFARIGRFFDEIAAARPLVVVLEDLHWGDSASLD